MAERLCLDCGEPLMGRIDKKFCNDYCRTRYNNRQNTLNNEYVRKVNTILRKNYKLLHQLIEEEKKSKTTKENLLIDGFNFYYFTNTYETQKGKMYKFVYDYGYLELEDEQIALVKKKEYVK